MSAMQKKPIIEIANLTKNYHSDNQVIPVLKGINLKVYPGEIVSIMGPSGEGKSTLMYILGLLQSLTDGTYFAAGEDVSHLNRSEQARFRRKFAGFVFQSLNLFEHSTVYENLEFPLMYAGVEKRLRPKMIEEALSKVSLTQQRVSIARAMVNRPKIIFADEPTGQLDTNLSKQVLGHFREFVDEGESAIIIVTHDPEVSEQCMRRFSLRAGYLHELT